MLAFVRLCLLAAFSALVSADSKPDSTPAEPTVYNNCSGHLSAGPPDNLASTPFYKPQIRINPLDINKNGTAWEEWMYTGHNTLPDGSELMFGYKFALGDPTSANVSHQTIIAWAYFPNGTLYREIGHGNFEWEEYADGSFKYTLAGNSLGWDATKGVWNTSISLNGYIFEGVTVNVDPGIPYAPDYKSKQGQISEGYFSRLDVPRGHTDGTIIFPWGLKYTVQSVGSLKHTWSQEIMANTIAAYVRGTTFLPGAPPLRAATLTWFQAWDNTGKEVQSMQYLAQPDGDAEEQVLRIQMTDASDAFNIVTTPKPVGIPILYNGTEITLPMCGPGADPEKDRMTWKVHNMYNFIDFLDFANGHTMYQRVNMTGHVWVDGKAVDFAGGIGTVEIYHR